MGTREQLNTMVVEDSRTDLAILTGLMNKSPFYEFVTTQVGDVDAARAAITTTKPDIIFLDLGLPGTSWDETLSRMTDLMEALPVVVLTGDDDVEIAKNALRHGAQDFLVKGKINPTTLENAVRNAIERSNLRQKHQAALLELAEISTRHQRMLKALDQAHEELERQLATEQALKTQLVEARKLEAIGQLAAGIAHEINTPAQFVGDNIRFLAESLKEMMRIREAAEKILSMDAVQAIAKDQLAALALIREEVDEEFLMQEIPQAITQSLDGISRIGNIVQAMKTFSHPGTTEMTVNDLNKAIASTITVATNEWKYVATMETDFDETLPLVPCFLGELNQVFLNIIVNAAHAIESGPREKGIIHISTRKEDGFAVISLKDNGCGIPKENLDKVFNPFFTTKEVGKGTGQGLAIAYMTVVEKHNGQLLVDSVLNEGTTFTIKLPLEKTPSNEDNDGNN